MTARRPRVQYVDPRRLPEAGRCLHADGVYRRRAGLPDKPALLTDAEIAELPDAVLDPYMTDEEYNR